MSANGTIKHLTLSRINAMKGSVPIVCLTAYTTPATRLLDFRCDLLLLGDSLRVLYGMDSTIGVTSEMMSAHGGAVMRGVNKACVVVDMPFGVYQEAKGAAYRTAVRILQKTSCDAVKLEGGTEMAETIAFLVIRGIPVMGHIGLMPQQVNAAGGYRSVGHCAQEAEKTVGMQGRPGRQVPSPSSSKVRRKRWRARSGLGLRSHDRDRRIRFMRWEDPRIRRDAGIVFGIHATLREPLRRSWKAGSVGS